MIYFWLCWDFFAALGLSLAAASGGSSPGVAQKLVIARASLDGEHRL